MTRFYSVFVTCKNRAESRRIANIVLEKRLAACANIFAVESIFRWGGSKQRASESAMLLKTRVGLVKPLMAEIRKAHSYKVPCIVAFPIERGNPDFLRWVSAETR
jgi:periplasmic divalent cation tolerance protein